MLIRNSLLFRTLEYLPSLTFGAIVVVVVVVVGPATVVVVVLVVVTVVVVVVVVDNVVVVVVVVCNKAKCKDSLKLKKHKLSRSNSNLTQMLLCTYI